MLVRRRLGFVSVFVVAAACVVAGVGGVSTAWSAPAVRTGTGAAAQHASLSKGAPSAHGARMYVVHDGEGWWQIAQAHHVSMKQLLDANHATLATKLEPGKTIHLPAGARAPGHAAAHPGHKGARARSHAPSHPRGPAIPASHAAHPKHR
jgi:hypothetical protein